MVKKLNAIVSDVTDNQLVTTVRETASQIWLAGLGAFARAQDEGTKFFDSLVKDGESMQERTKTAAGDTITNMTNRTTGSLDKLEHVFQERVARALKVLGVPSSKDIGALSDRVAQLTDAVARLLGEEIPMLEEDDKPLSDAGKKQSAHAKSVKGAKPMKADETVEETVAH